ncbi:putative MFS transporter [Setomelanomma holmii]|uniref:MFS transporter n=1 Tax=Setomelanomma holmii TaxID=210430 RepID=A0A9P4HAV1_9PLEO|nr:putative MFS transporter [Setomelanomma holmii]
MENKTPPSDRSNATFAADPLDTAQRHIDVEKNPTLPSTTHDASLSDIVDWEGENDPATPMNWTNLRKFKNISVICYCTFLTPLGSTMFAPAIGQVMTTYHSSNPLLASFVVSVWILGYFFGPLFLGPLSDLYGRLLVYWTCNVLFTIFNVVSALLPSLLALVIFRFLAGTFGGCPITIGAGTFGDLIRPHSRGKILAIWSLGPIMGPILGPIAGGYLGEGAGWRWICWTLAIASGVGAVASFIFQEETYPPVLLARKTRKLVNETGNQNLKASTDMDRNRTPSQIFGRAIIRPLKLLFLSPTISILSFYVGLVYGFMYLLFTTFLSCSSLTYIGLGIGSLLGLGVAGFVSDKIYRKKSAEGPVKPEYRIVPLIPTAYCIPVGLFIYGWTTNFKTHWIAPETGTVIVGIGINVLMMCVATYFIDANPHFEASANAACTALRSLVGALVPLFGRSMYKAMGLGWGNSLLGFLTLALAPLPWLFFKYGERIRTNPRFRPKM